MDLQDHVTPIDAIKFEILDEDEELQSFKLTVKLVSNDAYRKIGDKWTKDDKINNPAFLKIWPESFLLDWEGLDYGNFLRLVPIMPAVDVLPEETLTALEESVDGVPFDMGLAKWLFRHAQNTFTVPLVNRYVEGLKEYATMRAKEAVRARKNSNGSSASSSI